MLKIKGAAFKTTMHILQDRLGERYDTFLSRLPDDLLKICRQTYPRNTYYDTITLVRLMEAYARFSGMDAGEVCHDFGRRAAEKGINDGLRFLFKVGSPYFVIKKAPILWRSYYDRGQFEVEGVSPAGATIRIRNADVPHVCMCHRITGWLERMTELSGGENVTIQHTRCAHQGDESEEWRGSWSI